MCVNLDFVCLSKSMLECSTSFWTLCVCVCVCVGGGKCVSVCVCVCVGGSVWEVWVCLSVSVWDACVCGGGVGVDE